MTKDNTAIQVVEMPEEAYEESDWMHELPGYRDELKIIDSLRKSTKVRRKGGEGSGGFGHTGRPGLEGGSSPEGITVAAPRAKVGLRGITESQILAEVLQLSKKYPGNAVVFGVNGNRRYALVYANVNGIVPSSPEAKTTLRMLGGVVQNGKVVKPGSRWFQSHAKIQKKDDKMNKNSVIGDIGNVAWVLTTKEEIRKKEVDGLHPADHYLVVEDPKTVTTWHLRVKNTDGKVDPRLMGAAWAALHGGYRGNQYEGAKKKEAIEKLKALYEDMKRETPEVAKEFVEFCVETVKGGVGSGNFGHVGRPGKRGGSAPTKNVGGKRVSNRVEHSDGGKGNMQSGKRISSARAPEYGGGAGVAKFDKMQLQKKPSSRGMKKMGEPEKLQAFDRAMSDAKREDAKSKKKVTSGKKVEPVGTVKPKRTRSFDFTPDRLNEDALESYEGGRSIDASATKPLIYRDPYPVKVTTFGKSKTGGRKVRRPKVSGFSRETVD